MKPLIIRSLNLLILFGKLLFKEIFFQMKIIFNFTHVMAVVFCKVRLKKLERNINYKEREREREKTMSLLSSFAHLLKSFYRQPNVSCCKLLFNCESATWSVSWIELLTRLEQTNFVEKFARFRIVQRLIN